MIRTLFKCVALILLTTTIAMADVQREEHIANFQSNIVVNADASIDVTENITAYAAGQEIKRGIVRWLPTRYTDSYGVKHVVKYDLKQVLVNEAPSAYHTNDSDKRFVIYVGKKNVFLKPGYYTYTITYHVDNAINFLGDGDELYWNVTGNNWDFAILKTTADITLPQGAKFLNFHAYVGKAGERGTNYQTSELSQNQMSFNTGYLAPNEGLTIAVAWPKGFVKAPTQKEKIMRAFEINKKRLLLLEVAGIVLAYYLIVWFLYGRDPRKGTIIPLFEPPNRLSPAAIRYITRMGFDMKAFTAAVVDLATKKFITIKNDYDDYTLVKIGKDDSTLSLDEIDLQRALFQSGDSLHLSQSNASLLKSAKNKFKTALKETYQDTYFKSNLIYLIPGLLFTIVAFAIAILGAKEPPAAAFSVLWLTIWGTACSTLVVMMLNTWQKVWHFFSIKNSLSALFTTAFTFVFSIGLVAGLTALTSAIEIFTVPVLFFIMILNLVFYHLMKVPTAEGRKLMDQIEGFKLFLSTTERYRLESLNPPKQTPELFEKYLPYAIALDVENQWGELFNASLRQAGIEPNTYHPRWYSGVWTNQSVSTFPVFLGTGLTCAVASASVSSSSSGSGGGGSSGGGGGGGGGGGW